MDMDGKWICDQYINTFSLFSCSCATGPWRKSETTLRTLLVYHVETQRPFISTLYEHASHTFTPYSKNNFWQYNQDIIFLDNFFFGLWDKLRVHSVDDDNMYKVNIILKNIWDSGLTNLGGTRKSSWHYCHSALIRFTHICLYSPLQWLVLQLGCGPIILTVIGSEKVHVSHVIRYNPQPDLRCARMLTISSW